MRLWTLHPKYLDTRGLVALWREGLLAQAVLRGLTVGYTRHSQLARFRAARAPVACIGAYLRVVQAEAARRGYRFDRTRIVGHGRCARLDATTGQLEYEWRHLKAKLRVRDRGWLASMRRVRQPDAHPLFRIVAGPVEQWEAAASRRHSLPPARRS
jgi:hypothetical protein